MSKVLEWFKTHHAAVLATTVVLENTGLVSGKLAGFLRVLGESLGS